MADILNSTDSPSTQYANVGQPSSGAKLDHFTGMILTYDNFSISAANRASWALFLAALQAATVAALPINRAYPITNFVGLNDTTPAPEKKTTSYGNTVALIEKPQTYEIEIENFGVKFSAELRKLNTQLNLRAYFLDPKHIFGETVGTEFQGFEVDVKMRQVKVGNVTDYTKYILDVQIVDPDALTTNIDSVPIPANIKMKNVLKGCLGVTLSAVTGGAGVTNVKAITSISQTDMYDSYADALAVASAWVARDSSGIAVTISAVAKVPASKSWALTTTTGVRTFELADAAALVVLLVGSATKGGFESEPVEFTVV